MVLWLKEGSCVGIQQANVRTLKRKVNNSNAQSEHINMPKSSPSSSLVISIAIEVSSFTEKHRNLLDSVHHTGI